MKTVLVFNMPKDVDAFKLADRGSQFYSVLCDIRDVIRSVRKYGKKPAEAIVEIEELINDAPMDDIS